MDGKLTPTEVKILDAINKETLTNEQWEGGLVELIRREMEKNERPTLRKRTNGGKKRERTALRKQAPAIKETSTLT